MAVFSSTQPALRARLLPRFPAQVLAGTGISITKTGGTYIFAVSLSGNIPISGLEALEAARLLGSDLGGPVEELTVSGGLGFTGAGGLELTSNQRLRGLSVPFNTVSVGAKQDLLVPVSCTITRVTLLADQVGDVIVDIWKDTYANFPPTVADTITGGIPPTIVGADKYQDAVLAGWTTGVLAGDILRFNVDSFATITRLMVCLDAETL